MTLICQMCLKRSFVANIHRLNYILIYEFDIWRHIHNQNIFIFIHFHFFHIQNQNICLNLGINIANLIFSMNWTTSKLHHTGNSRSFAKKWIWQRVKCIYPKRGVTFFCDHCITTWFMASYAYKSNYFHFRICIQLHFSRSSSMKSSFFKNNWNFEKSETSFINVEIVSHASID